MKRDELLTKLAMELHPNDFDHGEPYHWHEFQFTGDEYLQRRTELINRPSWDDAPEWAQWRSQNQDGSWCWHELEPTSDHDGWIMFNPNNEKQIVACRGAIPAGHDWRDTLEPRPAFYESRADAIGQNGNDVDHYAEPVKWTSKTCIECGHATAAKVSDDKPACPGCVTLGPDVSGGGASLNQVLDDHMRMASEKWARGDMEARSKYHREIKPGVWVDVYDVLKAWDVKNPALQHLIKKALAPGERGHKTLEQDMADIVVSAKRAKELES